MGQRGGREGEKGGFGQGERGREEQSDKEGNNK